MNIETQEKIAHGFLKICFIAVFVVTLLYIIYEPTANLNGTDYKTAWVYGMAFGFTFTPVMSWILPPIIKIILKYMCPEEPE